MKLRRYFYYFLAVLAVLSLLGLIFNIIASRIAYRVTGINVSNQETVSAFETIKIALTKKVTPTFQESCSLLSQPEFNYEISASDNVLVITPQPMLELGQNYTVTLNCEGINNLTFQFRTVPEENLSAQDAGRLQTLLDFETAQALEQLFKEQPWRKEFPIIEEYYDLVYSQTEDSYYVYFKIPPGTPVSVAQVKTAVNEKLQTLNAPEKNIIWNE